MIKFASDQIYVIKKNLILTTDSIKEISSPTPDKLKGTSLLCKINNNIVVQ